MSLENVEIVRRCVAARGPGDYRAARELIHPAVVVDLTARPDGEVYRGQEAAAKAVLGWAALWDDYAYEAQEFIDADDHVVVLFRETGRGKESGVLIEFLGATVWRVSGGQVVYTKTYTDRAEALEAVGLSNQAMPRENIEVIEQHYAAYNRKDIDGVLATLAPDIEIDLSATEMPETLLRGHAQIGTIFAEQWSTGPVEQHPREFIEVGDGRFVVPLDCCATFPIEGAGDRGTTELHLPLCDVWTLRDGRGVRIEVYPDRAAALEAVGLSE